MPSRSTTFVAMLVAALSLTAAEGVAVAQRSIELTPERGGIERIQETGSTTITDEFGIRSTCDFTKTLRINNVIAKVVGEEIGRITAVEVRNCRDEIVRPLLGGLPWIIRYRSFTGTLPDVTEVIGDALNFEILVADSAFGLTRCLYSGFVQLKTTGNPITGDTRNETRAVPLVANLGINACAAKIFVSGALNWRPALRVRLI